MGANDTDVVREVHISQVSRDEDGDNKPDGFHEPPELHPQPGCVHGDVKGTDEMTVSQAWGQATTARSKTLMSDKKPKKAPRKETMSERAMGIGSVGRNYILDANLSRWQQRVTKLVRSTKFEAFFSVLIMLSAIHIGIQTDYTARNIDEGTPPVLRAADICFCIIFSMELLLRLFAFRGQFFVMYGWGWNVFDTILISSQLMEEMLQFIVNTEVVGSIGSTDVLRVVRVLRTVRAVRVLHVMKFANDLQMLVSCVMQSFRAFFWSLSLVLMVLYVVAVYLTQLVNQKRIASPEREFADLMVWFKNLPVAVLALFQALTGGCDWKDILNPLMNDISGWIGIFFPLFIAFVLILVLNVVAATFVESAHHRAGKVRDMQKMAHASRLFKTVDKDGSGYISLGELVIAAETVEVQDFFRSIDVDVSEATYLFEMIDSDHSGQIEFHEFLSGCLRLQGSAKSMDMVMAFHHLNSRLETITMALGCSLTGTLDKGDTLDTRNLA